MIVGALALAAVGSVYAAITLVGAERGDSGVAPIVPSAAGAASATVTHFVSPPARILTAASDRVAWRTSTTTCLSGRAVIEGTVDGGATWTGYDLGTAGGLSGILALGASTATEVPLVAVTRTGCTPTFVSSTNSGAEWVAYSGRLGEAWYVPTPGSAAVMARGVSRQTPCTAVAQLTDSATPNGAVLCSDQRVFRTADGGATWDAGVAVPGAVALSTGKSGYVVATIQQPGCGGVSLAFLSAVARPGEGSSKGCADVSYAADQIAIAQSASRLWLWAGGVVLVSTDEGNTWSR